MLRRLGSLALLVLVVPVAAPAHAQDGARTGGNQVSALPRHSIWHIPKIRGGTITPSHYPNQQLDTVWLAE